MGIKEEMKRLLLGPIVICFTLTAIISMSYALILVPGWMSQVKTGTIDVQTNGLNNLGVIASNAVQTKFQKIANDLLGLKSLFDSIYNGDIYLPSTINPENTTDYYMNAAMIASYDNQTCIQQIPGFDLNNNKSLLRAMWYVPEETQIITYRFWDNLEAPLQQFYTYFMIAVPYMSSLIQSGYASIYSGYEYLGADPTELFAVFPLERDFYLYLDYQDNIINNNSVEYTYYDFVERPWWQQSVKNPSQENSAIFVDPYLYTSGEYGTTVCTSSFQDLEYGPQTIVTCIDFDQNEFLSNVIENIEAQVDSGYVWLATRSDYSVLIHPNLTKLDDPTLTPTLSDLYELTMTPSELTDFMSQVDSASQALTVAKDSTNFTYIASGNSFILNLFLITIDTGSNYKKEYLLGITQEDDVITAGFESVSTSIRNVILIQIIILIAIVIVLAIFALIMITCLAKSFSRPFDELVKYVTVLKNFSEEKESDEDHQTLLELSHVTESNYSREINLLFAHFSKQLRAIQLAKQALSSTNDTEALVSFAQALQLYHDIGSNRGEGIIMYNLGILHFQAQRYQEAISCFKESVVLANKEIQNFISYEKKVKEKLEQKAVRRATKMRARSTVDQEAIAGVALAAATGKKKKKPPISLASLDLVRWSLEEQLINRRFQLARTIILFAKTNPTASLHELWGEVVESFHEVIKNDTAMKRNPARIITCYIELSSAYTEIGNYYYAEEELNKADKKISAYEHFPSDKHDVVSTFIAPAVILKQTLNYHRAVLAAIMGEKRRAAEIITATLEYGRIYDPRIRKLMLIELKKIFQERKLLSEAPSINKILESFDHRNKDIILLLDYSQSMGEGGRIGVAINCILKLFDKYIKPNDRVGFIRFNMNCDIIFSLNEKKKNTARLRKQFEDSLRPSGGTAIYSAIMEALKIFQRVEARNNAQWIVALTDGDDNDSRISFEQTFKKLARSDVNLIIIGLALPQPSIASKMSYLCKATKGGIFIESLNNESLNLAFEEASDIIYGNDIHIENITI